MAAALQVRDVLPVEYGDWCRVLAASEEGSPYQLPEYLHALAEATNGKCRLIGAFRDDDLVGGMGLYLQPATLGGIQATSRLLLYYNGPFMQPCLSQHPHKQEKHRRDFHRALEAHVRHCGYRRVRFKTRAPHIDYRTFLQQGWQAKPVYSYVIDLQDLPRLWEKIDNNLRRLVRRCERENMIFSDEGSFDAFLDMHEETSRRKEAPLYLPRERFRKFITTLRDQKCVTLFQVSAANGVPVATQLVLHGDHPVAHTLSAGSSQTDLQSGCNALLRWRVCQWLANRGYRSLDLTDAHNTTVARFKSQLGAEVQLGLQLELPPHWLNRMTESTEEWTNRLWNKLRSMAIGAGR
ncbi:MAG: GNAT family N-acetyltransferase [Planctomycetota bacterium]|nr:GNAT family N-acetyltransferase [Planctomycetota bacterium]